MAEGDKEAARGAEDKALKARLEKLSGALELQRHDTQAREAADKTAAPGGQTGRWYALGMRVVSELVGGVLVGAAIGWGLDWLFSTRPILLIMFLLLGMIAGFWNVIRAVNNFPQTGKSGEGG